MLSVINHTLARLVASQERLEKDVARLEMAIARNCVQEVELPVFPMFETLSQYRENKELSSTSSIIIIILL